MSEVLKILYKAKWTKSEWEAQMLKDKMLEESQGWIKQDWDWGFKWVAWKSEYVDGVPCYIRLPWAENMPNLNPITPSLFFVVWGRWALTVQGEKPQTYPHS